MIGDSNAELDFMLADLGVTVRYGSVSVRGLKRQPGDVVNEGGVAIVLEHNQVRVRAGVLGSTLSTDTDIEVDGDTWNITHIGKTDIEGLQALTIVPRSG